VHTQQTLGRFGVEGHLAIQQRLFDYFSGGRIHPSIILAGPGKELKFQIAKHIAKFIFCKNRTPNEPFCKELGKECSNCRRIEKGLHPDVLIYQEDQSNIKIEIIRQLSHHMQLSPMEGLAKVCIIEDCDRMNTASANAFLKTLEEPGPNRYFLLLTSKEKALLPTVRSRCLTFYFKPELTDEHLTPEEIEDFKNLLSTFLKTKRLSSFKKTFNDKERCLHFVYFLQAELRNSIISDEGESILEDVSSFDALTAFEESVQLEGRLYSNANHNLMMENYLKRHFAPEVF